MTTKGQPPPEFYEVMARHCRCCTDCSNPPCDGVCAGGMCDEQCHCDDSSWFDGLNNRSSLDLEDE